MAQTQTEIDASITRRRAMAASKAEEESLLQIGKRRVRGPQAESTSSSRWGKSANFEMPSPMVKRPRSADGKVSFHFSFTPVSKQGRPIFKGAPLPRAFGGTLPGQAAAHSIYIERDGAAETVPDIVRGKAADAGQVRNRNQYSPPANSKPAKDLASVYRRYEPTPADVAAWSAITAYQSTLGEPSGVAAAQSLSSVCNLSGFSMVPHNQRHALLLSRAQADDLGVRDGTRANLRSSGKGHRRNDGEDALGGLTQAVRGDAFNASYQQPPNGTEASRNHDALAAQVLLGAVGDADFGEDLNDNERAILGAQERASDGTLLLFSNIHEDPFMRTEYWRAVERCEATPRKHSLDFDTQTSPAWWEKLAFDKDTPAMLRRHLEPALQSIRAAIESGEPPPRIAALSVTDEQAGEALLWSAAQPGWAYSNSPLAFKSGRGGRTQFRLVTELPHEIDTEARALIVDEFCESLKARGFMYTAVVHAPDLHNDKRNYHLHLVIHDRPARWMEEHDAWDFEVAEVFKYRSEFRTRHPFRQTKIEEASQDYKASKGADENGGFVEKLRIEFADISNRVLAAEGVNKQYDHRTYEKMGIDREPTEHLGPKASALESIGVTTAVGSLNAIKIWSSAERTVNKERDKAIFESQARGRTLFEAADKLPAKSRDMVKAMIAERTMHATNAAEYARHLLLLRLLDEKAKSRAIKTRDTCLAHLSEIKTGHADKATRGQRKAIEKRFLEAQARIDAVDIANAIDKPLIDGLTADVEASLKASERLDANILTSIVGAKFTPDVIEKPTERSMLWNAAATTVPVVDGVRTVVPGPAPVITKPANTMPANKAATPSPTSAEMRDRRLPTTATNQANGIGSSISTTPGTPLVSPATATPVKPATVIAPTVPAPPSVPPLPARTVDTNQVAPVVLPGQAPTQPIGIQVPPVAPVRPSTAQPVGIPVTPVAGPATQVTTLPSGVPVAPTVAPVRPVVTPGSAVTTPVVLPPAPISTVARDQAAVPPSSTPPVQKADALGAAEPSLELPAKPSATPTSPRLDLRDAPVPEQPDKAVVERDKWDKLINRINETTMILTDHGSNAQPRFTALGLTPEETLILANPRLIKRTNLRLEQIHGKQQFETERLRKWLLSIEHQSRNFPIVEGKINTANATDHIRKLLNRYRASPALLEVRDAIIERRKSSTMSAPPVPTPTVQHQPSPTVQSARQLSGDVDGQHVGPDPMATSLANFAFIAEEQRQRSEARKAEARRTYPEPQTAHTPQVRALLEGLRNDDSIDKRVRLVEAIIRNPAARNEVMRHGPDLAAEFWARSEAANGQIAPYGFTGDKYRGR